MALKVEIVDISKNADNILLVDSLTIEVVKIKYNWLLNAGVKNAVVGEDSNGLVWYSGEWLCGDWEGGTWYSGIWHNGNWKKGDWHSYLLDKSMILVGKFIILDRNETYSEFRKGVWYTGNWYDGTFGDYYTSVSGKTWTDIKNNNVDTSIWKKGEWYNGVFQNSVWVYGNFYNGYMYRSYWVDGHFHKGIFNRYEWFGGLWYGGDFLEGIWNNGRFQKVNKDVPSRFGLHTQIEAETTTSPITIWRDGEFYDGEFHSGLNLDSSGNTLPSINHSLTQWNNGIFNGGNWYGGSFIRGIFNGGKWYGGVFNAIETVNINPLIIPKITECTWNDGIWYNGLWINGKWNGGHFYNGMWLYGEFNGDFMSTNLTETELLIESISKKYLASVTTNNVESVSQTEATAYGTVNSDGNSIILQRGIYWSTIQNSILDKKSLPPDWVDYDFTNGSLGQYSIKMTNLTSGKTYYYGAYVINLTGFTYGEEKSFTTLAPLIGMPVITVNFLSSISSSQINVNYQLNYVGDGTVIRRGICWGTTLNPVSGLTNTIDIIESTPLGVYQQVVSGLTQLTTYYFRAYAENSSSYLSYSNTQSIKTIEYQAPHIPILTLSLLNYGFNDFTTVVNITDIGETEIISKGICWTNTSTEPIISDNTLFNTSENLNFQTTASGIFPEGSTCYVKGFAINGMGTGYTNKLTVTLNKSLIPTVTNVSLTPLLVGSEYRFDCTGFINKNNSNIIEMGFDYTGITSSTYGHQITTLIPDGGSYSGTLYSLNPGETYNIKGFAKNNVGTGYSIVVSGKTLGTSIPAEIYMNETTLNELYQIGTSNNMSIAGGTTPNAEIIFNGVSLYVENALKDSWNGYVQTFNKSFTIEPKGDIMTKENTHLLIGSNYEISSIVKAEGRFGNPQYVKTINITKSSVYPILIDVDNTLIYDQIYYKNGTFYDICASENHDYIMKRQPTMGFQISCKNTVNSNRSCHIGYYYKYGDVKKMTVNGTEYTPNMQYTTVKANQGSGKIVNSWYVWYNIINIDISASNFTPGSYFYVVLYF